MVVSLQGIPPNSQVMRFITSGKKGNCELCFALVEKLEAHHLCYSPEITIKLCHNCHHKAHFWPLRLSEKDKLKLLSKRLDFVTAIKLLNEKVLGYDALAKLIAPSRNAFIHAQQKLEISRIQPKREKPVKINHSPAVKKVNKEVLV